MAERWKFLHTTSWLIVGSVAILTLVVEPVFPRPLYLFFGISIGFILMTASILFYQTESQSQIVSTLAFVAISGTILRVAGMTQVVLGSGDQRQLLSQAQIIVNSGAIDLWGHYETAPLYILLMAFHSLISDVGKFDASMVVTIASAFIPLLVAALAYITSRSLKTSMLSAVLTGVYALYLRSGILAEADGVAVIWFLSVSIMLMIFLRNKGIREEWLLVSMTVSSIFVHLLYSSIISSIVIGSLLLHSILYMTLDRLDKSEQYSWKRSTYILVPLIIGVAIPSRVLYSEQGYRTLFIFHTLFEIPDASSLLKLIIPTSGAAAEGVGSSGDTSTGLLGSLIGNRSLALTLYHVGAVVLFAAIGAALTLLKSWRDNITFYAYTTVILGATTTAVVLQFDYNLSYRFYYFASIPLLVFASISILRISGRNKLVAMVILLLLSGSFMVGPLVPLGNDLDPRFGGESFAVTSSEYSQEQSIHFYMDRFPEKTSMIDSQGRSATCSPANESLIWDSGTYFVCYSSRQPTAK